MVIGVGKYPWQTMQEGPYFFYSGNENLNRKPSNRLAQICAKRYHQLLQPAAKERQREAGEKFGKGAKLSADLREPIAAPAEHRKSTAEAAKANT